MSLAYKKKKKKKSEKHKVLEAKQYTPKQLMDR